MVKLCMRIEGETPVEQLDGETQKALFNQQIQTLLLECVSFLTGGSQPMLSDFILVMLAFM